MFVVNDLSVAILFCVVSMLGWGSVGMGALENLDQAGAGPLTRAFLNGVIFNISNILLVVAIDAAGMSVAFPVGVGLALVIGTVASYVQSPKGIPALLFAGVSLVVLAMLMSAVAHSRLPRKQGAGWARGIVYAVIAGCLMGFFYPQLAQTLSPAFNTGPIVPGYLTPCNALMLFGAGLR
jgi:glucose uptake protein